MEFDPTIRVGHWTDSKARTGCTVVLFPEGTVASGEVRGGAPATRDFALLEPTRLVDRLDAVVLSGGSAFGLATCDGVMNELAAQDIGFETRGGVVPIVVGMSLFDLGEGDSSVRPDATAGAAAARSAAPAFEVGQVGAGTGAMTNKWRDPDQAEPGGVGAFVVRDGALFVAAIFAVNAAGAIDDATVPAAIADGSFAEWGGTPEEAFTNTTIGVTITNAALAKTDCRLLAESAHDGLARALFPPHRQSDGDAVVSAALGLIETQADVDQLRAMCVVATEQAVRSCTGGVRLTA